MRHQEQTRKTITLNEAKEMIRQMGGTPLNGAFWEDERFVYASSVETVPGCYGHPRYEVQFGKQDGWLSRSNFKPVNLWKGESQ